MSCHVIPAWYVGSLTSPNPAAVDHPIGYLVVSYLCANIEVWARVVVGGSLPARSMSSGIRSGTRTGEEEEPMKCVPLFLRVSLCAPCRKLDHSAGLVKR